MIIYIINVSLYKKSLPVVRIKQNGIIEKNISLV